MMSHFLKAILNDPRVAMVDWGNVGRPGYQYVQANNHEQFVPLETLLVHKYRLTLVYGKHIL